METVSDRRSLFLLHAEMCKAIAHPARLEIISVLRDGEKQAGALLAALKISKANLSQHLTVLRTRNIIAQRRDGTALYYRLVDARVSKACDAIRDALLAQLARQQTLLRRLKK